jgi:hypothetical protein
MARLAFGIATSTVSFLFAYLHQIRKKLVNKQDEKGGVCLCRSLVIVQTAADDTGIFPFFSQTCVRDERLIPCVL